MDEVRGGRALLSEPAGAVPARAEFTAAAHVGERDHLPSKVVWLPAKLGRWCVQRSAGRRSVKAGIFEQRERGAGGVLISARTQPRSSSGSHSGLYSASRHAPYAPYTYTSIG